MFVEHKERGEVTEAPAKTLDEASKLLLRAADYMQHVGKCGVENKCGIDTEGRVCAYQALNMVYGGEYDSGSPLMQARKRLSARFGGEDDNVMNWSDTSPQEAVLATMRSVALGL